MNILRKWNDINLIWRIVIGLVIGAIVGGWIGGAVFGEGVDAFFSLSSWLLAILGSLIVLVAWGFISRALTKD